MSIEVDRYRVLITLCKQRAVFLQRTQPEIVLCQPEFSKALLSVTFPA